MFIAKGQKSSSSIHSPIFSKQFFKIRTEGVLLLQIHILIENEQQNPFFFLRGRACKCSHYERSEGAWSQEIICLSSIL